jgi:hypothetical protein
LVVLATMAWPSLRRPLADRRLRAGAEQLRAEWTKARVHAISSGRVYIFRYAPGTDQFRVESQITIEAAVGDGSEGTDAPNVAPDEGTIEPHRDHLPDRVQFVAGETEADRRSETVAMDRATLADASVEWAQPVYFYPDGTATSARITLENQHGSTIEVSLRGVTGVASMTSVRAGGR